MAGGRHRLLHGQVARTAVQQADAAPGLVVVEAVQAVAGGDAGLAPGTGVEVDAEAVLLAGGRPRERDQRLVAAGGRRVARLVALGEAFDRGQILLFEQQLAHQQTLCRRGHDPSTMRDRRWGYQGRMGFKLLKLLSFLETTPRRSRNQPETRGAPGCCPRLIDRARAAWKSRWRRRWGAVTQDETRCRAGRDRPRPQQPDGRDPGLRDRDRRGSARRPGGPRGSRSDHEGGRAGRRAAGPTGRVARVEVSVRCGRGRAPAPRGRWPARIRPRRAARPRSSSRARRR